MAIIAKARLQVLTVAQAEQWSIDQWAERIKAMAERFNDNRKVRIPDLDAFKNLLAGPAIIGFQPLVSADFVSRSGLDSADIRASFNNKLEDAFEKYNTKLDYLFAEVDGVPAKRFKDLVDLTKTAYSHGVSKYTIPFTGSTRYFKGVSPLAGMWLTGDPRTVGNLRGGDQVLIGGPMLICTPQGKPNLRTQINQRIVQAGSLLVKQQWEAGAMTKQNDLTNAQINGLVDPTLNLVPFATAGESHVNWIVDDGVSYLEIQIGVAP